MHDTEFTFRVGLALGKALAHQSIESIPSMQPGQRYVYMWSEPDWYGNRYLLTFELRESDMIGSNMDDIR